MPTVTQHAPGTFCWPELATTDAAASRSFYGALFGWTTREAPMEQGVYTMFLLGGREAGAVVELGPGMRQQGVPSHWSAYVSVENADAAAQRARALGGQVVMEPFDVMEQGRMAVIRDPLGATFSLWQPKQHFGVGVTGEPGSLAWVQLNAKDPAAAKPFYTGTLGWASRDDAFPGGGAYTTWLKSDGPAGGMMPMPAAAPAPSHWLLYFAVADVDLAHGKALSLGAQSMVPPSDIPGAGRFAVLGDPQGALFAIVRFGA